MNVIDIGFVMWGMFDYFCKNVIQKFELRLNIIELIKSIYNPCLEQIKLKTILQKPKLTEAFKRNQ